VKIIAQNKKAHFDYEILDRIETGIVLTGDEVKSLRKGQLSLIGAFATVHDGELFMINATIAPYKQAFLKKEGDETRSRKLLLHKKELNRLIGDISKKGITLIPLKLYFNEKGKVKVDLGICKHKKAAGKKQALKERYIKRETLRELKNVYKY
jgi:SsrA-binding protein